MSFNSVGFGTGEPSFKPYPKEMRKIGNQLASAAVSNLALSVVINYFCPKWGVPNHTAVFVGLITAASYSLTNRLIEYFNVSEDLGGYKQQALLVVSAACCNFLLLGKAFAPRLLSLSAMNIGMLEVGLCFNL